MHDTADTSSDLPASDTPVQSYTWEIRHDDVRVKSGVDRLGTHNSYLGTVATTYLEVGTAIFTYACEATVEDHRDRVVEARIAGQPDPVEVCSITVILRDASDVVVVSMTAILEHCRVTDDDIADYHEMMEGWRQDEQRLQIVAARAALHDEIAYPAVEFTELVPAVDIVADRVDDPLLSRIVELQDEAADLRAEVFDPDQCRQLLFRAEERLRAAQVDEADASASGDETALARARSDLTHRANRVRRWHNLLAETTAAYLEAAALDAEAAHLRRQQSRGV